MPTKKELEDKKDTTLDVQPPRTSADKNRLIKDEIESGRLSSKRRTTSNFEEKTWLRSRTSIE